MIDECTGEDLENFERLKHSESHILAQLVKAENCGRAWCAARLVTGEEIQFLGAEYLNDKWVRLNVVHIQGIPNRIFKDGLDVRFDSIVWITGHFSIKD